MKIRAPVKEIPLLDQARAGDAAARNDLIFRYRPFVMKIVSRMMGRYIHPSSDDEASIGLIAFNEAIDSFRPDKGVSFLTFAQTVIRRRLIDFIRSEMRRRQEVPLAGSLEDDGGDENDLALARQAVENYHIASEAVERRDEIERFGRVLEQYGLSIRELARLSPRHENARRRAMEVARIVAENAGYREFLSQRGELPLKDLEKEVRLSRKTLERQRKYIIALVIIMMEDFFYLRDYLKA
ncbi:MAG: RNA polymerase sigma-I factor [Firmicutes bacterium]|nr:RNA polymerase sigma-I factor [Bacillota bacterium]